MFHTICKTIFFLAVLLSIPETPASAGPVSDAVAKQAVSAINNGAAYLAASQGADGGWQAFGRSNPAITALAVKSLLQHPDYGEDHPVVRRGLEYMLKSVKPDGGIYVDGEGMRNYHTSVALMALSATTSGTHATTIKAAQDFLRRIQWDENEGHESASSWYGGQGYGRHKRPDLSNTQYMLEALHQSGLPASDPAYKKALTFISRCQMLSETNDQPLARGSDDGGFIYTPVGNGESKAGTALVEGQPKLRSYGSMTYAGFKSMLYASLDREDVRVKKAWTWIRRHYTLDSNPNMPNKQAKEGLYYYYHTMVRALDAWGEEIIVDANGRSHNWREELCAKLITLQSEDGSWVNQADRWYEGNPHLVTAYAVLTLQIALDVD